MAKDTASLKFETRAVHAGQAPEGLTGAVMTPIFQTSTFAQTQPGQHKGYEYARTGNPTRTALQDNLASLENGKFGFCFASGCAAADALFHLLKAGDHVLSCDDVYGGTYRLLDNVFRQFDMHSSFVDLNDPDGFDAAVKNNTKMLWLESPTNPLLQILDLKELCAKARKKGILTVVDNTFASPYLQQPLDLGADVVLHSSTKYIGGHSDLIGGTLVTNDPDLAKRIAYIQNAVGAVPAPFDCFLQLRSTKTLALRMEAHSQNAQKVAEFLESHAKVEQVMYPGLASHPQHKIAKQQMKLPGGMVSFKLKGDMEKVNKFYSSLKLFAVAESLGGVESLANHPATMTHASIPKEIREARGVTDNLIRLSVGIEHCDDILADLKQALGN